MIKTFIGLLCLSSSIPFLHPQQIRSDHWLSSNDRGNRYEGSYTQQVKGNMVNLVSLIAGTVPEYQFQEGQSLNVRFYSPGKKTYQLRSEELTTNQFYWMQAKDTQAKKGWNTFSPWPVDEVLRILEIPSRNLGMVVEFGNIGSRMFVPVVVFKGSYIASHVSRYTAHMQLGLGVAYGNYKIFAGKQNNDAPLFEEEISEKDGGDTFPLPLPLSVLPKSGWYSVEINLREKNRLDLVTYSFSFYHLE